MDKKKEYYTEELEKLPTDKMKAIKNQKYYTVGSIILMFVVLTSMYFHSNISIVRHVFSRSTCNLITFSEYPPFDRVSQ